MHNVNEERGHQSHPTKTSQQIKMHFLCRHNQQLEGCEKQYDGHQNRAMSDAFLGCCRGHPTLWAGHPLTFFLDRGRMIAPQNKTAGILRLDQDTQHLKTTCAAGFWSEVGVGRQTAVE